MSLKTLDELQWSDPAAADEMQGIHSNSVLFYFMRSPYFDKTSNNNTVYNQALHNASMFPILATRDRFEDFLKSMSGVEYIVHQAPAEMAPGTGTGVWVIRKQLRRKRNDGQADDLTVYADYFVVGYNIYQAPTLADILSSRIASMAVSLSKAFPAMDSMQTWTPARGHVYETGDDDDDGEESYDDDDDDEDEEDENEKDEEMKDAGEEQQGPGETAAVQAASSSSSPSSARTPPDESGVDPRLAEESFALHLMYGGDYMDEQPITGRPGEFHQSLTTASANNGTALGKGASALLAGSAAGGKADAAGKKEAGKDGKEAGGKGGKSGSTAPKPKRRKSKGPHSAS